VPSPTGAPAPTVANVRCPSLADLPPPPPGRVGWPWTEEHQVPEHQLEGRIWPPVSIVTPSYNQGLFLEETIRSVLLQGYPGLEYSVIDGGSTDQSVEVIRKYEAWLAFWISQPDQGQADAINFGLRRSSGEIMGWLNSDDVYEPGCIDRVATQFAHRPSCMLLYGNGWYIDADGTRTSRCKWIRPYNRARLLSFNFILQPAAFWRRSLWQETGELEITYHWAMDWDWFIRATARTTAEYVPVDLARFRLRPEIKSLSGGRARAAEIADVSRRYGGKCQPTYLMYQLNRLGWSLTCRLGWGPVRSAVEAVFAFVAWFLRGTLWRGRSVL
jgi:glycosyltransferase involved in cell wall biosynthesis